MRTVLSITSALISATVLCALCGTPAVAAEGRSVAPSAIARREREHPSSLAGPIALAQASLQKLSKDKRRRKYRDGWDAIAHDLGSAIHRSPNDARVDEARLLLAHVREELWLVSRTPSDAHAAVAAYASLDEIHPGSVAGRTALISAVHLAHRAHLTHELAASEKRLAHYPRSAELNEALALAPGAVEPTPSHHDLAPAGHGLDARAATPADRTAMRPADSEDDDATAPASVKSAPVTAPPAVKPSLRAERLGLGAPASPSREPNSDVPAGAAAVLDQLVQAARGHGAADLLGETGPSTEKPLAGATGAVAATLDAGTENALSANHLNANDLGNAPKAAPPAAAEEGDDSDVAPEPEEADDEAAPRHTSASAPRAFDTLPSDADSEKRARDLRKSALGAASSSLAAQLGLKVHTVVVDAGHGGHDAGAIGPHGLREKDVTLNIARKLADKLRAAGLTVVLTRDSDDYVALSERTRIANEANADLFVSVHCNAARRRKLEGVETWTLNTTADRYAQRLAAFENAEADATVSTLRMILADLATKANASDARELAETVQSSMVKNLRSSVGKVKDNGVKQALFYVLLGTHMPSILVETAFLSNPVEEKRLKTPRYQDGAADAIARGVQQFISARRELARAP